MQITAQTKDALEEAIKIIEAEMEKELPNLIDERRFRRREPEEVVERDEYGRVSLLLPRVHALPVAHAVHISPFPVPS